MNFQGIIVGLAVFLIIGICHPIVIKMEYHWGKNSWWVLLVVGLVFCALSLITQGTWAVILGAAAFSCFWGIHEMLAQEMRVLRGWFPENPKRHEYYQRQRAKYPNLTRYMTHRNLFRKKKKDDDPS